MLTNGVRLNIADSPGNENGEGVLGFGEDFILLGIKLSHL
jgi:hypothetical protein